jgi:hypothetical protein
MAQRSPGAMGGIAHRGRSYIDTPGDENYTLSGFLGP